jgi:hypothetical protein
MSATNARYVTQDTEVWRMVRSAKDDTFDSAVGVAMFISPFLLTSIPSGLLWWR